MHHYKPYRTERLPIVDLALPGVEAVTYRNSAGTLESILHGGPLDGQTLASNGTDNAQEQHARALRLARIAGRGRK